MKIKAKLRFNTWISLGVVILVLLSLAWSFREANRADRAVLLCHEMAALAFDRILLRDDYLLHQEERAKIQWMAKSEALRKLLKSAPDRFKSKEEESLLKDAQEDFEATFSIFSTILEKHEPAKKTTPKTVIFDETDLRLIDQVFLKAYALNDDLSRLHDLSRRAAITAQNKGVFLVILFIASGVVAIIVNSVAVNRLITERMTRLQEGMGIIGAGNLEYRLDVAGDDELSHLSRSSNEMAAKLEKSHISVENLQKEVFERKQSEEREQHLSGLLRAIRNVNQLIVRERDVAALTRGACELLIETREYYSAWIALFDPEGRFLDGTEAGIGEPFKALITQLKEGRHPQCCAALQTSGVHVLNDPEKNCPGCPIHHIYENRAALSIRLEHGGRVYGLLVISMPPGYLFMAEEQSLAVEIAGDLGLALHVIEANHRREQDADKIKESEQRYHFLFDNMLNGFAYCKMIFDGERPQDFIFLEVNEAFEKLTGLTDVVGKKVTEVIPGIREQDSQLFEIYGRVALTGKPEVFEIYLAALKMWLSISAYSLQKEYFAVVFDVITERKRAEDQIRASLREKDIMLQEIHHRVKNNLQVIQSLLNLQSKRVKDSQTQEAFKESRDRIGAMALIHEKLYQAKDLSHIDMVNYLQNLSAHLFQTYRVSLDKVKLKLEMGKVQVGINQAVPLGLILNELISNALKHAFPEGREGRIRVRLVQEEGLIRLTVGDNGVGLPEAMNLREPQSMGFQVIMALVEQLDGTIELHREEGTEFRINFPEE
jgi:two-component sensor histidine kinase